MALSDISLTSGMRNNLQSLQNTKNLIEATQGRLSSGKKVNTALDNPTNFFAAQSANQRASDLDDRKDGMSEAVQQIKAADAGISAISSLIGAAKGLATSALSTSNTTTRSALSAQYDTIRTQIDQLSSDASYRGKNLLKADTVTVQFNEGATSSLSVVGFSAFAGTGGLGMTAGNTTCWQTDANITADTSKMDSAVSTLRTNSATLSANLNIVTTRQDFTNTMINTLQTGADNLTLADMNQEGANMLMLQTRQSLGTTSLSLSSQAAQSILRLF